MHDHGAVRILYKEKEKKINRKNWSEGTTWFLRLNVKINIRDFGPYLGPKYFACVFGM